MAATNEEEATASSVETTAAATATTATAGAAGGDDVRRAAVLAENRGANTIVNGNLVTPPARDVGTGTSNNDIPQLLGGDDRRRFCPELLNLFLGLAPSACSASNNSSNSNNSPDATSEASAVAAVGPSMFATIPHHFFLDYLTVRDLINLRQSLPKTVRDRLEREGLEYVKCRDGRDYLVPYPGFPGLLPAPGSGLFSHQLASLRAMHRAEEDSAAAKSGFGALRGGILGDAPGLGKTITTLALVASTAGRKPVNPPEFWVNDEEELREGWGNLRINEAMKQDVLSLFRPIDTWCNLRLPKPSPQLDAYRQLRQEVSPAFSDGRFPTISEFERHVTATLRDAVGVERSALDMFRENLLHLKPKLNKRNRRLLARRKISGANNGRRLAWERLLTPVSATLIVVPDPLLEHWAMQIGRNLNLKTLSESGGSSRGVAYLDGIGDLADVLDSDMSLHDVSSSVRVGPQPTVVELSQYTIVLTTFSRAEELLKAEVASGRMEGPNNGSKRTKKRSRDAVEGDGTALRTSATTMLQMRWLRLIVDEGHELGTHEAGSDVTRFVNEIAAERRWVLSGTPTTGDEEDPHYTSKALDQLQRLLLFLRHPEYGLIPTETLSDGSAQQLSSGTDSPDEAEDRRSNVAAPKTLWGSNVKLPFLERSQEGRNELLRVLKDVLVLHRKEDIDLPAPIFRQTENYVPIPDETETQLLENYQGIALIHKFDEYLHSAEFQSLVDAAQARYIVQAVDDARAALMKRGGPLSDNEVAAASANEASDRRRIKAVVYSPNHNILLSIAEHVIRFKGYEQVAELYETRDVSEISSELSRFRTGVREFRRCPLCHHQNAAQCGRRRNYRCTNTLLEVVTIAAPQRRFLIEPERIDRTLNVPLQRMKGEPLSDYSLNRKCWRVNDCLLVDIREDHPARLASRHSDSAWLEYGSEKCRQLAAKDGFEGKDWYFGPLPETSEDSLVEVRLAKWQECGAFHRSLWYQGPQLLDEPLETEKHDTHILMLHANLSNGLDLSFLTHIFLLEPINDAALLEQVTSRAHRLGATGPVTVETVNVFYKTSHRLDQAVAAVKGVGPEQEDHSLDVQQDVQRILSKEVCEHCYRVFESKEEAIEHERISCPRNPENSQRVDPFHLSSVYREVRPPPALQQHQPI